MIGVVGLGYVGLPLACLLSSKFTVLGFDKDTEKLEKIASGFDPSGEVDSHTLTRSKLFYSSNPDDLKKCEIIIVCVPTPVCSNNKPNFEVLLNATRTVGKYMQPGTTVVFESTVYPGVTETMCAQALMEGGDLQRSEFKLGYSPERVNPGDKKHRTENIVKLVSGEDQETLEKLMNIYGAIAPVYACHSIKVAEATKLFENVQRDINIAYVNEFTTLCHHSGISMKDVLEAAKTKWNALNFYPGLVGGDCIYTDPYYALQWRENQEFTDRDSLIFQARQFNTSLPSYVSLLLSKRIPQGSSVLFLGLTFKPNVRDCRNSGALKLAQLLEQTYDVFAYDPLAPASEHTNPEWEDIPQVDAIFVAVGHDIFQKMPLKEKLKENGIFLSLSDLW